MELILALGLLVALLVIVCEAALLYLLLRQHGQTLLAHDDLRSRLLNVEHALTSLGNAQPAEQPPPLEPLTIGAEAPEFALPGLDGTIRHLHDFLDRPVVVTFFNPDCGFCAEMAPELGRLRTHAARMLLVSRGDADWHRRMAEEHGWQCEVVLEPDWTTATAYRTRATPTGYLVGTDGRIASAFTVGATPLLELAASAGASANGTNPDGASASGSILDAQRAKQLTTAERARAAGLPIRDITASRINRNGLPAGTEAPDFELADLAGELRSLTTFRGKRVLLVFSDPNCAPCEQLTPSLVQLSTRRNGNKLQVLMVSKGDLEENRQKARDHGIDFPVLIQRGSEVAKKYGSFATPVGYMIDEQGILASGLAIGADAILTLGS